MFIIFFSSSCHAGMLEFPFFDICYMEFNSTEKISHSEYKKNHSSCDHIEKISIQINFDKSVLKKISDERQRDEKNKLISAIRGLIRDKFKFKYKVFLIEGGNSSFYPKINDRRINFDFFLYEITNESYLMVGSVDVSPCEDCMNDKPLIIRNTYFRPKVRFFQIDIKKDSLSEKIEELSLLLLGDLKLEIYL